MTRLGLTANPLGRELVEVMATAADLVEAHARRGSRSDRIQVG